MAQGKLAFKEAVINSFRNPGAPQASLSLGATRPQEVSAWGGQTLEVKAGTPCPKLQQYLNGRTRGSTYVGTVIQIDSDRSVQQIQYQPLSAATPDPDDQEMNYSYYLSPFGGRWTNLMNRIHQKVASRDHKLATHVKNGPPNMTFAEARRSMPDPFTTYQQIFAQLLPGKTLEPINTQQPGAANADTATVNYVTDANGNPIIPGNDPNSAQVITVTADVTPLTVVGSLINSAFNSISTGFEGTYPVPVPIVNRNIPVPTVTGTVDSNRGRGGLTSGVSTQIPGTKIDNTVPIIPTVHPPTTSLPNPAFPPMLINFNLKCGVFGFGTQLLGPFSG